MHLKKNDGGFSKTPRNRKNHFKRSLRKRSGRSAQSIVGIAMETGLLLSSSMVSPLNEKERQPSRHVESPIACVC